MASEEETATPAAAKRQAKRKAKKARAKKSNSTTSSGATAKFPRHTVEKALRIPKAIIEQNAGRECSEADAAMPARGRQFSITLRKILVHWMNGISLR
jgi:hypothetical protein